MKTEITSGLDAHVKGALRLGGFISLAVLFVPAYYAVHFFNRPNEDALVLFFYRVLNHILGFQVRARGKISTHHPTFFASNHSSYLDVPVLGGLVPASFVAKSEVASWPLIGALARMQKTIFVERRAVRAGDQTAFLRKYLEKGRSIIFFPEGTSSDGHHTLPFKSSLFKIVEKDLDDGKKIYIQPVSIVCTQIAGLPMGHLWRPYYAWYGDMTFAKHLWDVFKIGSFTVDVVFHPAVTMDAFASRKELAAHCHKVIAAGVSQSVAGRKHA